MGENNLEKFIFYRFIKASYIVLLSLFLILLIYGAYKIIWGKEIDYLSSKVKCYNGKDIELCCEPFLYVRGDNQLDKKNDYLVRKMCDENSNTVSTQNYDLSLKFKSHKINLFDVILIPIFFLVMFIVLYIPLNLLREIFLYVAYGKPIYWRWLWKWRIFS